MQSWEEKAQQKRSQVLHCIPSQWIDPKLKLKMAEAGFTSTKKYLDTIIDEKENAITKLLVGELREVISLGKLTATEVTRAFCHRAALAHQIVSCCSEIFFDEALARARELDEYFTSTGKTKGPLHGIPISLKDQVDLEGKDSSIGFVSMLGKPKSTTSLLAKELFDNGAVFYVKTTVPMAMMAPETVSNIFGYTYNSLNINLSSGGSSGGEGSLIGANGSPLGFGTDIGGSIRIPSSHQGLYALKPSTGRISYLNVTNSVSGQEAFPSVIGPMATSLEDIELITKLIVEAQLWKQDPKVMPVPWKDVSELKKKKLTFGVWRYDNKIKPHPYIQRALTKATDALKLQGHEVLEIQIPNHDSILETALKVYGADDGYELATECAVSGEPVVPIVAKCVSSLFTQKPISVNQWWDLCNEVYSEKQLFLSFWEQTAQKSVSGHPIDGIIAPVWPSASVLPLSTPTLNYTAPFNLCDCALVVLPVTTVDKAVDKADPAYVATDAVDKQVQDSYDPELYDGMPVCIQVVTKKLEEEKALALASVVEECLK